MNNTSKGNIAFEENRQHECRTNKMVACIMLGLVSINVITQIMMHFDYSKLVSTANKYFFLPMSAVFVIFIIVAMCYRFDRSWIKYMLTGSVVIMTASQFFVFTVFTSYFVLIPLIVSSRYFNKSFAIKMNTITVFLFAVACILNIMLADSWEFIHIAHERNQYNPWHSAIEALVYVIIPLGLTVLFVATYGVGTTKNGGGFLRNQAQAMDQIASVDEELRMAAHLQQNTLPPQSFTCPDSNFSIQADEVAAKKIGGDFYDYFMLDNHTLAVLVADVSDKGIPAAMFMMSAQKAIHYALESSHNLSNAIAISNRLLCNNNDSSMFLTLWLGVIDTQTGKGKYVNAGHPFPLIKSADGKIRHIQNTPDLFIGAFPDIYPEVHPFSMYAGDTLVLFTDGITDAENSAKESFGVQGIYNAIDKSEDEASAVKSVMEASIKFADGEPQFDDMTLLALHCNETQAPITRTFETVCGSNGTSLVIDGINDLMNAVKCPEQIRQNIDVVADELCGNIADYAYGGDEGPLTVKAEAGENYLCLVLCDEGVEFNPVEQSSPVIDDEPCIGGLGIYLAKKLSDFMSYRRVGNTNELTVEILWGM